MLTLWLLVAVLQTSSSASTPADVPADARAAIARANNDWLGAMQRRDARTVVEPYADDGVFVLATGESVKGRAAIEQMMNDRFSRMGHVTGGTIHQDGLIAAGSMLYEWGHADLDVAAANGQPASHFFGRYLTVWKKDAAGRWRIIRNLSLSD